MEDLPWMTARETIRLFSVGSRDPVRHETLTRLPIEIVTAVT